MNPDFSQDGKCVGGHTTLLDASNPSGGVPAPTPGPSDPKEPKKPKKPVTPKQQQCLDDAKKDHDIALSRATQDANHTWWVDIRNSVGGGAVGGCVVGAIGGEGIGCAPAGAIGALGGLVWGVPSGLWDASNQFDTAVARADADFQSQQDKCMQ
jgi:hypothetical protein